MTALNLAKIDDLDRLIPLVTAFHAEEGVELDEETRRTALLPLLEGSPHGAIYLIGPGRAPIGYIVVTFGWSIEFGGMDGLVDEFFIRPGVRRRGIGSEVLRQLPKALGSAGVKALHLEVAHDNTRAQAFYRRLRFEPDENYMLMSRKL